MGITVWIFISVLIGTLIVMPIIREKIYSKIAKAFDYLFHEKGENDLNKLMHGMTALAVNVIFFGNFCIPYLIAVFCNFG
ncbi:hypothetical protein [Delftia sp. WSY_7]|uniref:hypothetical protein n=1 Tax=Delftia sp. WSY_7 TaxID=3367202 RepID=UPI00370B13BA